MSVSIPSSFDFGVDLGVDLDVSGIPTSYSVNAAVQPLTLNLNLAPVEVRPIDFSLRLKEIPAIRAHLPLDYRVGLTLLGAELLSVRLVVNKAIEQARAAKAVGSSLESSVVLVFEDEARAKKVNEIKDDLAQVFITSEARVLDKPLLAGGQEALATVTEEGLTVTVYKASGEKCAAASAAPSPEFCMPTSSASDLRCASGSLHSLPVRYPSK